MKRILFVFLFAFFAFCGTSQSVIQKLASAFRQFENDPQLKAAIASIYVLDAKTGKLVFEKNGGIGLAPASTQKIITAASAYELLGKSFRYKTEFALGRDASTLYVLPSGDPTLGSWRWINTQADKIMQRLVQSLKERGLKSASTIIIDERGWEGESIPDGWIWQDIGNYYGTAAKKLNWRENQFDLILKSGKNIGDRVEVVGTVPKKMDYELYSVATSAAKGSGDNAYIYFPLQEEQGIVRGTIPINENSFTISGAVPPGEDLFLNGLFDALLGAGIQNPNKALSVDNHQRDTKINAKDYQVFHTEVSPPLDSIVFWLNKKSINLYAEALLKTMAHKRSSTASSMKGVEAVKEFWKSKGIETSELNIVDGSGLSPLNRVTTSAQVRILHYSKNQTWFPGFYNSLPDYNGMKMKSGTIGGAKGFAGYHTSKAGSEYIFSFLVNNYTGSSATLVQKMYRVLDELK